MTVTEDRTVRVWDVATASEEAQFPHKVDVMSASMNTDGTKVATSTFDGTVRVWDVPTGREETLMQHKGIKFAAISPDGAKVITASMGGEIRIWNVAGGKEDAQFQEEGSIKSVAVSPRGTRAVIVTRYGEETDVCDVATGTVQDRLRYKDHIEGVQFSLDGTKLITTSMDGTVRIWDIATGKEQARFSRNGKISSATFSSDGKKMVIISKDGLVRVWDIHWLTQYHGRELIQRVCQEKLVGANHLTKQDIELSPILSGREGEDVCEPPSWFSRLLQSAGFDSKLTSNSN